MASEVLLTISRDEAERFRLMSELKHELDVQSKLAYAKQQGEKQGLRRGIKKSRIEIARNALAKGVPIEIIQNITGLDIETIRDIQAKQPKTITK